jgi:hypothetical protein
MLAEDWESLKEVQKHYKRPKKELDVEDRHVARLAKAIRAVERKLIFLGGWLDNIGEGGSGRLTYAINRAKAFAEDFGSLYGTLNLDDISGWTNYRTHVERGLMNTYRFIAQTGERLQSLRTRLQTVTETIQTTALIIETEATRYNTMVIRQLERAKYGLAILLVGGAAAVLKVAYNLWEGAVWGLIRIVWGFVTG